MIFQKEKNWRLFFVSLVILSYFLFFLIPIVQARVIEGAPKANIYILNVPIGKLTYVPTGGLNPNPFGEYFKLWYGFILGTIGILATVMIIIGGFQWLISRGNASQVKEGQDRIFAALIGLALAFLAYTILYLINPELTNINIQANLLKPIKFTAVTTYSLPPSGGPSNSYFPGKNTSPINTTWPTNYVKSDYLSGFSRVNEVSEGTRPDLLLNPIMNARAENLITELQRRGELPEGFYIGSGLRNLPSDNLSSQHYTGNAIDISWATIDESSAQELQRNIQEIDPSFNVILEVTPEQQSHYGASGPNVHADLGGTVKWTP